MMNKILATAAIVALGFGAFAPAASGAEPTTTGKDEQHCVVEVTPNRSGELVTTAETCFDSLAESAAYAQSGVARSSGSNTIGLHFTGLAYTGSSVRIAGTTCGGGVWYATGIWNNNIESSHHYCGTASTRFWDSAACSGSSLPISSSTSSLGTMNNRTSCVQYG